MHYSARNRFSYVAVCSGKPEAEVGREPATETSGILGANLYVVTFEAFGYREVYTGSELYEPAFAPLVGILNVT